LALFRSNTLHFLYEIVNCHRSDQHCSSLNLVCIPPQSSLQCITEYSLISSA